MGAGLDQYGEGPAADAAAEAMVGRPGERVSPGGSTARTRATNWSAAAGLPHKGYTPRDIRFTTKGDTLYATVMSWPADKAVDRLACDRGAGGGRIERVELLGHAGHARVHPGSPPGLNVKFPDERPCDYAYVLKITGLRLQ